MADEEEVKVAAWTEVVITARLPNLNDADGPPLMEELQSFPIESMHNVEQWTRDVQAFLDGLGVPAADADRVITSMTFR